MSSKVTPIVEGELNEHMFATLWKYAKYVLRFHMQGLLAETRTS